MDQEKDTSQKEKSKDELNNTVNYYTSIRIN